jgi:DNA-directed RNA polymerase specialized sigma24 family protein
MLAVDPAARPRCADVLDSLEIVQRRIGRLSSSPTVAIRGAPEECEGFQAEIEEAAFRGEPPHGALEKHLAWCRSCAETWEHERSLYAHPPELEARVLEDARREASRIQGKSPAPSGRVRASVAAEGRRSPELPAAVDDRRDEARRALERLGPTVFAYLRALLKDDERTQEAFSLFAEMLWREAPEGARMARVTSFRLAYNAASSIAERKREGTRVAVTEKQKFVESLSTEEATIVMLHIKEALSWEDIAAIVGTDPESARKRFEVIEKRVGTRSRLA